jgi:hypothetical protein
MMWRIPWLALEELREQASLMQLVYCKQDEWNQCTHIHWRSLAVSVDKMLRGAHLD